MKHIKKIGLIASPLPLVISSIVAYVLWNYLTEYASKREVLIAVTYLFGLSAAIIIYLVIVKYCKNVKSASIILAILAALVLAPMISMFYPGKITYSRFGFTVYGIIPVPILDITVGPHGTLWFRDKSHLVTADEVRSLLSPEVEFLIIGIGWNSAVQIDPSIQNIKGVEIHILPTPKAFNLFNKYKSEGKKAVLIAHSTC